MSTGLKSGAEQRVQSSGALDSPIAIARVAYEVPWTSLHTPHTTLDSPIDRVAMQGPSASGKPASIIFHPANPQASIDRCAKPVSSMQGYVKPIRKPDEIGICGVPCTSDHCEPGCKLVCTLAKGRGLRIGDSDSVHLQSSFRSACGLGLVR